ncbi:unnamed protein product [Prunus armeniaca]
MAQGCQRHKACMSQGDVPRHEVLKATQTLHVCKAMCLGTGVPKVTQGVARHGGTEGDEKLGCRKAM